VPARTRAARPCRREQQAPAALTQLGQDGVGRNPGAEDVDGRGFGPVLVGAADGRVLADHAGVVDEHVGGAQLSNRGLQRGAQIVGLYGVRCIAADVLAGGGDELGGVGVQLRLVAREEGDRMSGPGERAGKCEAEAGSDADNDCDSEGHGGPF
jgi:hypothetical protein